MLRKLLRFLWCREDGNAAVEMGLASALVLLLLGGALEFGIVMFQVMEVNNAVEAGAGYAIGAANDCLPPTCGTNTCTPGTCPASYTAAIENIVQIATGLGSKVTAGTPTVQCGCPNAAGSQITLSGSSCPTPCYAGGPGPGTFVTVSGQYSLLSNVIPFVPNNGSILPSTISFSSTVRVQ